MVIFATPRTVAETEQYFFSDDDEKHIYRWVTQVMLPLRIQSIHIHQYMLICILVLVHNNILLYNISENFFWLSVYRSLDGR